MADRLTRRAEENPELHARLREQIGASRGRLLGRGYQARALLYESALGTFVVKQAHDAPLLGGISRRAIRREHQIYERLRGIDGVPQSFGLIDGRYLVLEHVDGRSLRDAEAALTDRTRFYEQLLETIEAMHRAGVAHGDLKRKDNILIGPGERPYVIDFGVARLDSDTSWWHRWSFQWFKQYDYNAWVKLKYRRRFEQLTPADRAHYRPLLLERMARAIRVPAQKLTLRRLRRRGRQRS